MATLDYSELKKKYHDFDSPRIVIEFNDKDITEKHPEYSISEVEIDLSAGYEASIASFSIYNCFDVYGVGYDIENLIDYIGIGTPVKIATGYSDTVSYVFSGIITKINFGFEDGNLPYIRVTAMDIKGIMMANRYSRQLMAEYYHKAVQEILESAPYQKLSDKGVFTAANISATPDDPSAKGTPQGGSDQKETPKIEMVSESDYEFIVKAAKKFNYDFFINYDEIVFRPAKADTTPLMELTPGTGLRSYDIEYDITGQVAKVEVRATDSDKGEVISSAKEISGTWSKGKNAAGLIKGSMKVYLDSSVHSEEEAGYRAESLVEDISYRYGTISCDMIGIPDVIPGKFITVGGLGVCANNTFYLMGVKHVMTRKGEYKCVLTGKARTLELPAVSL